MKQERSEWRHHLHEIIFEADTRLGRAFDIVLIVGILASVIVVMLDSVAALGPRFGQTFWLLEWFFTILFTVEYLLRLLCVRRPLKYATSFFGVIDLLAILPTYISLILPGTQYLLVIRILRVLRIFRVFKLAHYLAEASLLMRALRASSRKIVVFLFVVATLVVIFGSLMYLIEGEKNGFTSIPRSVYWAIVTLTTVGYGDLSPKSAVGQAVAAIVMLMGFAIIAVPTGIVTAEMTSLVREKIVSTQACPDCSAEGHDHDATHCKHCGAKL